MKHWVKVVAVAVIVSPFIKHGVAEPERQAVCVDSQSGQCQFFANHPTGIPDIDQLPWSSAVMYSVMGSIAVGLTGIVPLIWMPSANEMCGKNNLYMNRALSFAAGALLGDVFLHILPESWNVVYENHGDFHRHAVLNGIFILVGIISFFVLEKVLSYDGDEAEMTHNVKKNNINGNNNVNVEKKEITKNGHANGEAPAKNGKSALNSEREEARIEAAGLLNLFANCLDNFTHGLAIGGSFLVSRKFGLMTTGAILLHEIPHEFGDFAILLRAGFERWRAAKWQIMTASGGLFGALFAHLIDARSVWWILPFTAGGFLHISLCTIIPDLMRDTSSRKESFLQLFILVTGVMIMGMIGIIE